MTTPTDPPTVHRESYQSRFTRCNELVRQPSGLLLNCTTSWPKVNCPDCFSNAISQAEGHVTAAQFELDNLRQVAAKAKP